MEGALVTMAKGDKTMLLHFVMRAWSEDVADKRDMDNRAAELAERMRLKEIHDQKIAGVLWKMEGERSQGHLQILFHNWRTIVDDKHQTGLAAEAEHLKELHRADIRKLIFKFAELDDASALAAMFRCWLEVILDARKLKEISMQESVAIG